MRICLGVCLGLLSLVHTSHAASYTVHAGDTLSDLSASYNVSVSDIKKINGLTHSTLIQGNSIEIPSRILTHIVANGDNLSTLSKRYNSTLSSIITLNNLPTEMLFPGQRIRIPVLGQIEKRRTPQSARATQTKTQRVSYKVQRGDTLSGIAKRYNVRIRDVQRWNDKASTKVFVGEKLVIHKPISKNSKKASKPRKAKTQRVSYKVQRGDTLSGIAKRYNVRIRDVQRWNDKASTKVFVGEKLVIHKPISKNSKKASKPRKAKTRSPDKFIRHKVKKGETLYSISKRYKVHWKQLQEWNHKNHNQVAIGESLTVYASAPYTAKRQKSNHSKQKKKTYHRSEHVVYDFRKYPLPFSKKEVLSAKEMNRGVEVQLSKEMDLLAPADATVVYAGPMRMMKYVVILELDSHKEMVYAHIDQSFVYTGQKVQKGMPIASVQRSQADGEVTLYVELRQKEDVVDIQRVYPWLLSSR